MIYVFKGNDGMKTGQYFSDASLLEHRECPVVFMDQPSQYSWGQLDEKPEPVHYPFNEITNTVEFVDEPSFERSYMLNPESMNDLIF